MSDWSFVLTPLLVLPILLLFRFVGCSHFTTGAAPDAPLEKPPRYRDYILGEPNNPGIVKNVEVVPNKNDVIGYWRLVDAAASKQAKDEKGLNDGSYVETAGIPPVPPSQGAPGNFVTGQPGLIASDSVPGRVFLGGHVAIPFDSKHPLFTEDFTIEAWVNVQWGAGNELHFEHTLFEAGGFYTAPLETAASFRGFRIYVGTDGKWQVVLRPGTPIIALPQAIPLGVRSHIAVTVQKTGPNSNAVKTFVNGKPSDGAAGSYALPIGSPLFIGIGNTNSDPTITPVRPETPMLASIQEVVLYRRALSQEEIENHVSINR